MERVPVLVRDADGVWHGRFHAINVIRLTEVAAQALRVFTEVIVRTRNLIEFEARPGSLLLYSNTRCMHSRRKYAVTLDGKDRSYVRLYLMPSEMLSQHACCMKGRTFA